MQYSILLLFSLFSASLSLSCNGLPEVCAANNCPAVATIQVDSFSYTANDFNLISFGSLTINNGDAEGRVAVRNNFNAVQQGVSIGYSLPDVTSPSYSLVAGGNVNWVNGEIYPSGAGIFVGGTFTGLATLKAKATGTCQQANCLNEQFNTLSTYFTGVSNALAAAAANVNATVVYQQLVLQCTGSAPIYTVSIKASLFNGVTSYATQGCDASSTFLFNIMESGKVVFQGDAFASHLTVYNLPMATSVEIDTFVYGDIIAPSATLNQTVGTVAGQVVAGDITALIQVNIPLCPNQTTTSAGATSTASASTASASTAAATSTASASTASASTASASTAAATSSASGVSSTSTSGVPSASSTTTAGVPSASSTTTAGVPSATSTGSTTGNNGNPICTFLSDQASCPTISNALNGNYTFNFANYDVIVFSDLTANSGDIEGRTFVYGNVNFPNGMFSLGLQASSSNSDYVLVAGGLNFASGSINRGRAFVAGSSSVASYLTRYVDGPCTNASCLSTIRSTGQNCYNSLSDAFANRSNAQLTMNGQQASITCNSNSDAVYYINTDSSMVTSASWGSSTNCNSGAIYVFNIAGSDDFAFTGAAFPSNNAVFNVRGSRTVTIGSTVHGNILAPQANIVMNSGLIVGKVVAASATLVQVNIPQECVNIGGGSNSGATNSATNSATNTDANSGASAGMNLTPSILVMLIEALFISKMF